MENCKDNVFCSNLPEDLRVRLCKHCIKSSHSQDTAIPLDMNHPWLLLSGIVYTTFRNKPTTILVPGDMVLTPRFRPEIPGILAMDESSMQQYYHGLRYNCLTPISTAVFSSKIVFELMEDIRFLKLVSDVTTNVHVQSTLYQSFLYQGTAYEAVRYVLKMAQAYRYKGLTHAQIARLSGRNRTTVTKIVHEIALAEPDLLVE